MREEDIEAVTGGASPTLTAFLPETEVTRRDYNVEYHENNTQVFPLNIVSSEHRVPNWKDRILELHTKLKKAHVPVNGRVSLRRSICVYICLLVMNIVVVFMYHRLLFSANTSEGVPIVLGCRSTFAWDVASTCGVNASRCISSADTEHAYTPYRCSSACAWIGDSAALNIIGSNPYRGDSSICRAAFQSGHIHPRKNLCFSARTAHNMYTMYPSSTQNDITSIQFSSPFPITLELKKSENSVNCDDPFGKILGIFLFILVFTATCAIYLPPPACTCLTYWSIVLHGFAYTCMIVTRESDVNTLYTHFTSDYVGFCSIAYLMYMYGGYTVLRRCVCPFMCTVLYILPYTLVLHLDMIEDIKKSFQMSLDASIFKRGTLSTVFIILLLICICVGTCIHIYHLHRIGELHVLVRKYVCGPLPYVILACIPVAIVAQGVSLHVHHYLLGMVLWPIVSGIKSRAGIVLQALLLGLFVNGIAIWGLAPMFDRYIPASGAPFAPPPNPSRPSLLSNNTGEAYISWEDVAQEYYYSVQLSEYEVYRGPWRNESLQLPISSTNTSFRYGVCVSTVTADGFAPACGKIPQTLLAFAFNESLLPYEVNPYTTPGLWT